MQMSGRVLSPYGASSSSISFLSYYTYIIFLTIYLAGSNKCFSWGKFEPLIVLDLQDLTSTHEFYKEVGYLSCKWGQTIAYLDASGNWEQVNLSANAFQVLPVNGQQLMRNPSIKVQVSYVLLNCRFYLLIYLSFFVSFHKQKPGTLPAVVIPNCTTELYPSRKWTE